MHKYLSAFLVSTFLVFCTTGCQPSGQEQQAPVSNDKNSKLQENPLANLAYSSTLVEHYDADGKVKVEISTAWTDDKQLVIRGVFTPDDAGYHLYSCKLPVHGVDGIGRPTLIEVANSEQFSEIGQLVAEQVAHELRDEVLNISLSVYPEGAVTLYFPLRFASPPAAGTAIPLKLTYMSCSDGSCNFPIVGALEEITLPDY